MIWALLLQEGHYFISVVSDVLRLFVRAAYLNSASQYPHPQGNIPLPAIFWLI